MNSPGFDHATPFSLTLVCEIDMGVRDRIEAGREYQATEFRYRAGLPFYYIPGHGWFSGIRFRKVG